MQSKFAVLSSRRSASRQIANCMLVQNLIRLTIEWLVLLLLLQFGDRVIEAIWAHNFRRHKEQLTSGMDYKRDALPCM